MPHGGSRGAEMRMSPVLLSLLVGVQLTAAQTIDTPKPVSEAIALQHLLQIQEPLYPAITRAARVQGDVAIAVVIDVKGKITSEKAISGPPSRPSFGWMPAQVSPSFPPPASSTIVGEPCPMHCSRMRRPATLYMLPGGGWR
jgi:hypothetical protein